MDCNIIRQPLKYFYHMKIVKKTRIASLWWCFKVYPPKKKEFDVIRQKLFCKPAEIVCYFLQKIIVTYGLNNDENIIYLKNILHQHPHSGRNYGSPIRYENKMPDILHCQYRQHRLAISSQNPKQHELLGML